MRSVMLTFAILMSALQTAAAVPQTADAFVHGIYAHYLGDPDTTGKGITLDDRKTIAAYFAPDIAAVMIKDEEAAVRAGATPSLDFDPFVSAQDWTITNLSIRIDPKDANSADALVRFKDIGKDENVRLTLVRTSGGWRISDILWPDNNGTLRGLYKTK